MCIRDRDSSEENLSLESDYGRLDFVGGHDDIKMLAIDDEESDEDSIDLKGTDEEMCIRDSSRGC